VSDAQHDGLLRRCRLRKGNPGSQQCSGDHGSPAIHLPLPELTRRDLSSDWQPVTQPGYRNGVSPRSRETFTPEALYVNDEYPTGFQPLAFLIVITI
jgi:hypothetical protein